MILMFVRHADAKNDKLTKLGRKQCKLALKDKEKFKFTKIYSSPANRCVKTARYFQNKYKIPLEILYNMKERELLKTVKPQNEQEQEWYDNYLNPAYSSKEPEGCKEYLTRNFVEFKKIIDTHIENDENAIIVAHSGTLYALYAYINGIAKGKDITWIRIANCSKIYFEIQGAVK